MFYKENVLGECNLGELILLLNTASQAKCTYLLSNDKKAMYIERREIKMVTHVIS